MRVSRVFAHVDSYTTPNRSQARRLKRTVSEAGQAHQVQLWARAPPADYRESIVSKQETVEATAAKAVRIPQECLGRGVEPFTYGVSVWWAFRSRYLALARSKLLF